jgi:hypothetical protein
MWLDDIRKARATCRVAILLEGYRVQDQVGCVCLIVTERIENILEVSFKIRGAAQASGPRAYRSIEACRLEAREPAGVRLGGGGDAV